MFTKTEFRLIQSKVIQLHNIKEYIEYNDIVFRYINDFVSK